MRKCHEETQMFLMETLRTAHETGKIGTTYFNTGYDTKSKKNINMEE